MKAKVGDLVRYRPIGDPEGRPEELVGRVLAIDDRAFPYLVSDPDFKDEPWHLLESEILEILVDS